MPPQETPGKEFLQSLERIVGSEHLIVDDRREFFATDVYRRLEMPIAVVRPGSIEEAARAIACAYANDVAIVARGGGASYTDGYLPATPDAVLIDAGRLDRIVEINERDMYVTVEPGVTWADLDASLGARGLRTPIRGPFSGIAATIGGSISQNALGLGTNTWGVSCELVLAMEVITANGRIVRTGQAGSKLGVPFYRHYGPDLTGLFTGDCGALGFKALITLKMIRARPRSGCLSFGFGSFEDAIRAMSGIAGHVVEEKCFALDSALQQGQIGKSQDVSTRLEMARSVIAASDNPAGGLLRVLRMGLAGSRALVAAPYAAHYIFEGESAGEIRSKARLLRRLALRDGREIPNSVPLIVYATPFAPLHNVLGPAGERWVPVHGILPTSSVGAFHREFRQYLASQEEEMTEHGVHVGLIFSALGAGSFLYEPAFYWKDEQSVYHRTILDKAYRDSIPVYPFNPAGAGLVQTMRQAAIEQFHRYGAGHLQVGKQYPLLRDRDPAAIELLRAMKRAVDAKNLFNPGALGL
ncbi:MAG: FAD-binding oxidoreductase [Gammaproteobacteria bacterium]|nr:FAD-binding oxidoreductase [Gammaproteobacteria bacterium]MDE0414463.1 FAD-binding oxidoreductase [Gammaproteobacteria bacterium]